MPECERIQDPQKVKKIYTRMRIQMFIGMYVGYVVYYFTRKNISPMLHIFSEELKLDITSIGLIGSAFYITYGVGKFVSGALSDRCNIRFFMAFGLFVSSIINLFYSYLPSLWLLVFFWGLNGAFQSMGAPPTTRGLVFWYAPKERATVWALYSSAHTCGTFLIGVLVAILVKYFDWHTAFYIPGIIGICTSVFIFATLIDKPTCMGLPCIDEYKDDPQPVKKESGLTHWQTLKKYVFFNPAVWYLALAYVFVYFVRFATLDWGAKFMFDVKGIAKTQIPLLWTVMPLLGMPGGILAGIMSDKIFKGRCTPVNVIYLILLAISSVAFYKYSSSSNLLLTCFLLGAVGFFVDGPQLLIGGVQVSRVTPQESVSTAYGLVGLFGYIGAILSGIGAAAIINRWDWGALYYSCAIACFIALFFVALTWKKESAGAAAEKKRKAAEAEAKAKEENK